MNAKEKLAKARENNPTLKGGGNVLADCEKIVANSPVPMSVNEIATSGNFTPKQVRTAFQKGLNLAGSDKKIALNGGIAEGKNEKGFFRLTKSVNADGSRNSIEHCLTIPKGWLQ